MRTALATSLALLLCCRVHAQDALPIEKLAVLKKAAVYVRVEVDGKTGSGSGFVVHRDGKSAIVVTNLHVAAPKIYDQASAAVPGTDRMQIGRRPRLPIRPQEGIPRPAARTGPLPLRTIMGIVKNAKLTVIFDSGTKTERAAKADVIAFDSDNDLAALQVTGVEDLPAPIDVTKLPELFETMPIYSFGFPFGKALAVNDKNPAITVGKASISSLREDDAGDLHYVQLDGGSLNPGNSGGMVVDVQGRLVGVVVSGIQNSGIAFGIPGHRVASMFRGRLGVAEVRADEPNRVDVDVCLCDPLGKVKSATLYYLAGPKDKFDLKKTKSLVDVAGVKKIELKLDKHCATVRLPEGTTDREFFFEVKYANAVEKEGASRLAWASVKAHAPAVAGIAAPGTDPKAVRLAPSGSAAGGRETRIVAGAFDARFRDVAPPGGRLIGLEVGVSKMHVVNAIRPIYRTAEEEIAFGKQHGTAPKTPVVIQARAGYAVAAVRVKSGLTVEGLVVKFAKIVDGKLDMTDTYLHEPIGNQTTVSETLLGDDGSSVVGMIGSTIGEEVTGLGLVLGHATMAKGSANLIKNGSFETCPEIGFGGYVNVGDGVNDFPGLHWKITRGSIDFISTHWHAAEGSRSIDLNGSQPGTIGQEFKTVKGRKYRLIFWLAGSPDLGGGVRRVRVSAADASAEFDVDSRGKTHQQMGWAEKAWEFVAIADTTTLEFASLVAGAAGPAIDDVSVFAIGE